MEPEPTKSIAACYTLWDEQRVFGHLRDNPDLVAVLLEARPIIKRFFPLSQVFLDVVPDYDTGEDKTLLVAIEATKPEEASAILDRFDQGWWLENMGRADGGICITLEFVDGPAKEAVCEEVTVVSVPRETLLVGQCQAGHDRGSQ